MTSLPLATWFLVPVILWDRAMRGTGCEMGDTDRVQEFLESEVKLEISKKVVK